MNEIEITLPGPAEASEAPAVKRRGNRVTRVPEILEVSMAVFAAEGIAGFTQRRVARDAGIRLNTLQHYFGTRDELLRSTILEISRRHLERYRTLAKDASRPAEVRLAAIVDEAFEGFAVTGPGPTAFALHCWSVAEHEVFVRNLMAESTAELVALLTGLVGLINPVLTSAECMSRGALIASHLLGLVVFTRRISHSQTELDALRSSTKEVWKAISIAKR